MKQKDETRIIIFKRLLSDEEREIFSQISDEDLLVILNKTVLPNSLDINSMKNTMFFGMLFTNSKIERTRLYKDLGFIKMLNEQLSKTESMMLKFGAIKGFTTNNWRKEMFRYINIPTNSDPRSMGGKKIIYSKKFEELFFFVYNIIKKGENNGRFQRF